MSSDPVQQVRLRQSLLPSVLPLGAVLLRPLHSAPPCAVVLVCRNRKLTFVISMFSCESTSVAVWEVERRMRVDGSNAPETK